MSFSLCTLSSNIFHATQTPSSKGTSNAPSGGKTNPLLRLASRIWAIVKTVFMTLFYYATCCVCDRRAKILMFAENKGFHILKSTPENATEAEALQKEISTALLDTFDASLFKSAAPEQLTAFKKALVHPIFIEETLHVLKTGFNSGIAPLEYRFSLSAKGLLLHLYAPTFLKQKKLPLLESRANKENAKIFSIASKWEETKEDVGTEKTGSKRRTISCYRQTYSLKIGGLPKSEEQIQLEKIQMLSQKLEVLKKEVASLPAPTQDHPNDTRYTELLQTFKTLEAERKRLEVGGDHEITQKVADLSAQVRALRKTTASGAAAAK